MCEYSLELYRSQPAEVGEKYKLERFPSGTYGLAVGEGCTTAACLKEGSKLLVTGLGKTVQNGFGVGEAEEAVFIRLATHGPHAHRDAVRFHNGREAILQVLGGDVSIMLLSLPEEKSERPVVETPELIDAD